MYTFFWIFFVGVFIPLIFPYPEIQGYSGVAEGLFGVVFLAFDIGTNFPFGRFVAEYRVKDPKKMMEYIAKLAVADSILLATCAKVIATTTATGVAAAPVTFGAAAAAAAAWTAAYSATCTIASVSIHAIMFSLISWIPVLMSLVVDEAISLCPPDAPWNLKDAFYALPGGEAGWEIFSAIPLVGDVSYAIGPYICWGTSEGKIISKLKQQVKSPYYYYDPTLSIYTAEKKYAQTANPIDPTQRNQITSGVFETAAEYTNHYVYIRNTCPTAMWFFKSQSAIHVQFIGSDLNPCVCYSNSFSTVCRLHMVRKRHNPS
jgi:hypothetical protein